MIKTFFLTISLLGLIELSSSEAQTPDHTVCLGLNCDLPGTIPDPYTLYDKLIVYDNYLARQNWRSYSGAEWDGPREQCLQRCQQDYLKWRASCFAVFGSPSVEEDPDDADARDACLDAGRHRRTECISPRQLLSCQ